MQTSLVRRSVPLAAWFFIYLVVVSAFALLHLEGTEGWAMRVWGLIVPPDWTATQFAAWAGDTDMASYVKAAMQLLREGRIDDWMLNFWPPGFPFTISVIVYFIGEGWYPLKMLTLSVLAWAMAFSLVRWSLGEIQSGFLRTAIPLLPMALTTLRTPIFGESVFGAESISVPLFVVVVCLVVRWIVTARRNYLFAASVLFAALAYLRAFFELFGNFLALLIVVGVLLHALRRYLMYRVRPTPKATPGESPALPAWHRLIGGQAFALLIAVAIFSSLLLPWRIFNLERGWSLAWLHAHTFWGMVWTPDNSLHEMLTSSGVNTPCHVDPYVCQSLHKYDPEKTKLGYSFYKKYALLTFAAHPFKWYSDKSKFLSTFWFGLDTSYGRSRVVEGVIIGAMGLSGFVILWRRKTLGSVEAGKLLAFFTAFLLFNIGLFTFLHFEWRYSVFLRMFFVLLPVWALFALPSVAPRRRTLG